MTARRLFTPALTVSTLAALPAAGWAHPGHEHSPGWLAHLLHSVTSWGPLLVVLVVAVAVGYRLWNSKRE